MEFVDGPTLSSMLKPQLPTPQLAAATTRDIALALEACHRVGVLHRDLKPANVMLTREGQVKVMDFGLAKQLGEADSVQTRTGQILGTPSYMAPEQASGVVKKFGPECDVYAIGAILYELLTGRPPFYTPDVMQTILMVLTTDPVPPRTLQPRVPRDLETICLKCLEKQPKKRFPSAVALADELKRYLDDEPIHSRPTSLIERSLKWSRRHPAKLTLIVASALSLLLGLAAVTFHITQMQAELSRSGRLFSQSQELGHWLVNDHIPGVAQLRGGNQLQSELVDKTLAHLQQLETDVAADHKLAEYISQAYIHIARVQADPAYATPARLEQALTSYTRAVDLLAHAQTSALSHIALQHSVNAWTEMSRLEERLGRMGAARSAVKEALAAGSNTQSAVSQLLGLAAREQELRLQQTLESPTESYQGLSELLHQTQALSVGPSIPLKNELLARVSLGMARALEQAGDDSTNLSSQTASQLYQQAIGYWRSIDRRHSLIGPELVDALEKLAQSNQQQTLFAEADQHLHQAVEQQQQLLSDNPESTIYKLRLLSLLDQQCLLALRLAHADEADQTAQQYQLHAQPLFQSDPSRFRDSWVRSWQLLAEVASARSQTDVAIKHFTSALEQSRLMVASERKPSSLATLAALLKSQAELIVERTHTRSLFSQQIDALESATILLDESLTIYEELGEATSSQAHSPYWQTIESKHRLEGELEQLRIRAFEGKPRESQREPARLPSRD